MSSEFIVTNNICCDEVFARRTLPYLTADLFEDAGSRAIFETVQEYWNVYGMLPPPDALKIELSRAPLPEHIFHAAVEQTDTIFSQRPAFNADWLMKLAEEWARAQAMKTAIRDSLELLNTPSRHGEIAEKVRAASSFGFDTHVGHDYIRDADARYAYYTEKSKRIRLPLRKFNIATCGGFPHKTLNIFQAGPNVGKTFIMTYFAAEHLRAGHNVLYLSMEISEMEIGRRIDANLLGIDIEQLNRGDIEKSFFDGRVSRLKGGNIGRLKIREFPTKGAGAVQFETLLKELATRENFVPDVIYVDYVGICSSSTVKDASNTYNYVGAITAELRGMAVRFEVPVVSAVQFNREGFKPGSDNESDMGKVADSFAIAYNADSMYSLRIDPSAPNLLRVGHVKSRYMRTSAMPYWTIGINYEHMCLYDLGGDDDDEEETIRTDLMSADNDFEAINFHEAVA